jgi:hypothetical protein
MANVVEIVVQGRDISGPAMTGALKNVTKLGKGFTDLKGAIGMASNVMQQFGFSATGIAATMAVAGVQIATDFFEKIETKAIAAAKGWDAFTKAVNTRRDLTQPSMVRERDINSEAQDEIAKVRASGLDKMAAREAENQIKITRDLKLQLLGEEQKLAAEKLVAEHRDQRREIDAQWDKEEYDAFEALMKAQIERENDDLETADAIFESKKKYEEDLAEVKQKEFEKQMERIAQLETSEAESLMRGADLEAQMRIGKLDGFTAERAIVDENEEARFRQIAELNLSEDESIRLSNLAAQEGAARRMQLNKTVVAATVSGTSAMFGNLLSAAQAFGSKGAKAAKGFAITKAIIDTYTAANGAYSAMASIPYVGPALGAAAAAAAIAAGMANVSAITSTNAGQAHAGMDYVPREGSYILQRGEAVLDPGTSEQMRSGALGGGAMHVTVQIDGDTLFRAMGRASRDGRLNISARGVV